MRKAFLVVLTLSASVSASMAQDTAITNSLQTSPSINLDGIVAAPKAKAPARREGWNEMRQRHTLSAKRGVNSMCVECLGSKYNKAGPKTPLLLGDDLSNYQGEPQLEQEP